MNTYTIATEAAGAGVTKYIVTNAQTGEVLCTHLSKRNYSAVLVNDTQETFSFHDSHEHAMETRNACVAKAGNVSSWGPEHWTIAVA